MAHVLIAPHAIAALVLAVAGLAKLRSPSTAAEAVGLSTPPVRIFAAGELALALYALVSASVWSSIVMAALYVCFALITLRLAVRGSACGCFGAERDPASPLHSLLSTALAAVALLSVASGAPGAGDLLSRSPASATVLVAGTLAGTYAIVLAYTELPVLWRSWSPA